MEPPRCFISYSWDSEQHQKWVRKLATRLRECGIDAILDQFHCAPGTDLTIFMEKSVRESGYVILVCTPTFAQKADAGVGGVGYEKAIVSGEIFAGDAKQTKFVPVLRDGDAKEALPSYLKSRLFIDFRDDSFFEDRLEDLLRHFHGQPLYPPPPIGTKPDWAKPLVSISTQQSHLQQRIENSIGMKFELIQKGTFMMGSELFYEELADRYGVEEYSYLTEIPQHKVTISKPFYLQSTKVTQRQWKEVIGHNPSEDVDCGGDCPVEYVTWYEAKKFIKKLNEMEKTNGYRLPTEAEWEYACRAGTKTVFFFGNNSAKLGDYAWYEENGADKRSNPVAQKKPNAWGLYDMYGNITEWIEDDYHKNYIEAPADGSAWIDNPRGKRRVVRGGFVGFEVWDCRSAARFCEEPNFPDEVLGFRVAKSVISEP